MVKKNLSFLVNLFIITLLVVSGLIWFRVYQIYSAPPEKNLIVTFLNVGQGDSILITTPNQKNILIDGGTIPKEWSTFDAGKKVVVPYLKKKGIKQLDLVIATHPDLDHIGGLIEVLKQIKVDTFLDSGTISTTQTYEDLLKVIEAKKINYKIAQQGDYPIDPDVKFEILSPISGSFANDSNNNSIVARLEYNKVSFLFTGDLGESADKQYVQKYDGALKTNVLKVAHHGGKNATSNIFLGAVQPEIMIISCGKNNPFGHPAKETMERLKKTGGIIYRTDESGNITIKTDGEKCYVSMTNNKAQMTK